MKVRATVTCECGETFVGRGADYFEASVVANRQRARCREYDPELHRLSRDQMLRNYQPAPRNSMINHRRFETAETK